MVTDRPDYTESTEVVHAGWVQVETGVAFERSSTNAILLGSPLFRIGMGHHLELRAGSDGFLSEADHSIGRGAYGRADTSFGFKYRIAGEKGRRPAFALIAQTSLPTGCDRYSSGAYEPELALAWSKTGLRGFGITGNFNWARPDSPSGRLNQGAITLSVDHRLLAGLDGFWEVYTLSGAERGEATMYIASTGVTRGIGSNAQWDVSVNRRITAAGPDWAFSFGLSVRQPFTAVRRLAHR